MDLPTLANPFPKNVTEDRFKDAVIHVAKSYGWQVFHPLPAINKRGKWATYQQGHKGYPDLTLSRDGVTIFRELKSNTGYPTPEQRIWGKHMGDAWDVWRPRMWEEIVLVLRSDDPLGTIARLREES